MKTDTIAFIQYLGHRHPRTDAQLPTDRAFFAVPGGGVAPRERIEAWARLNGVKVAFL